MGLSNILGVLSSVHISLFTKLKGSEVVGTDDFGNTYYRAKPRKGYSQERRWVIYDKAPEASMVPPEWHGWLHHQTDTIPDENSFRRPWQKPHKPNMTGTTLAYRPKGHLLEGGHRERASGDYEPWTPPQ